MYPRRWPRFFVALLLLIALLLAASGAAGAQTPRRSPRQSQEGLGGVEETVGVQYAIVDDQRLTLDAYVPPIGRKHPAIVAIHGGGFQRGFSGWMRRQCVFFAQNGFSCFSINYRLAPNFGEGGHGIAEGQPRIDGPGYPAQVDDVKRAIEFVRDNAERFQVDPLRVGTFGTSAGGTLALTVGAESQGDQSSRWEVAAAASWSGGVSWSLLAEVFDHDLDEDSKGTLPIYVFADPDADLDGSEDGDPSVPDTTEMEQADPYTHVDGNSAAFFLANSTKELVPKEMPTLFAEKLQELGVAHELAIFEGRAHATALSTKAEFPTLEFFEQYLRGFDPSEHPPVTGPSPLPSSGSQGEPKQPSFPILPIAIVAVAVVGIGGFLALRLRRGRLDRYYG